MPEPGVGRCKSCSQPVLWCLTKNEKPMPVNPTPILNGNLELDGDHALYVKPDPSVTRFVSHYSDCPQGDQHRKEKAAATKAVEEARKQAKDGGPA